LTIETNYPLDGAIRIKVAPVAPSRFAIKLRIPAWSQATTLMVNGESIRAQPASYVRIVRRWSAGDIIELTVDMRCRVMQAKQGVSAGSDRFQALVRGPVVLARDENIDPHYESAGRCSRKRWLCGCEARKANPARREHAIRSTDTRWADPNG
jgi:uncharacterized protein